VLTSKFLIIFFITYSHLVVASQVNNNKILPCLGKEEAKLFKKKQLSPKLKLNRDMINVLVNSPDLALADNFYHIICDKNKSASQQLLLFSLLYDTKIFQRRITDLDNIRYFLSKIPQLFFSYLAQIQANMPKAKCLSQKIPEIKYYLNRFKYLQADIPIKDLFRDKNKIRNIFIKLQNIKKIYKSCTKVTSKK
jgi:hypothetical protein